LKNSKAIGGDYERECAKNISAWLTGDKDADLVCWRSVSSGSIATVRKKKGLEGKNLSGDFQCLDSKYEEFFNIFYCDSKSLGNVHLMLINPNNIKSSQLFNEWLKVCKDAESSNKKPLMFVKARNDRKIPDFIIIHNNISLSFKSYIHYGVFYNKEWYKFSLMLLNDFFEYNTWKDLILFNKDSK
jgi:hypothetical protein